MPLLLLLLGLFVSPPDTIAALYAHNDRNGLHRLHAETRSTSDDLLVRYRLYPLTQDERYLTDLPDESDLRTAQDLALLSALWAYRAAEAPVWKLPVYGLRSDKLLQRARAMDPDDPYVLLVSGQSLLYRPRAFGGSAETALVEFERLRDVLRESPTLGISPLEPEVWIWYALRTLGRPHTDRVRDRLLAQDPPPLFRKFLLSPP